MDAVKLPPHLLRLPEVMKRTGLRRSTLYRAVKLLRFPTPLKIGIRCSAWRSDLIDAWILTQINKGY